MDMFLAKWYMLACDWHVDRHVNVMILCIEFNYSDIGRLFNCVSSTNSISIGCNYRLCVHSAAQAVSYDWYLVQQVCKA